MSTWFMWQHILKIAEHPRDFYCKTSLQNTSFRPLPLRNLKQKEDMWNVQLIGILSMYLYSLPAIVSFPSLKVPDSSCCRAPLHDVGFFCLFFNWGKIYTTLHLRVLQSKPLDANKCWANSIQFIKFLQQKMKNSDLLHVLSFLYTSTLISNSVVLGKGFRNMS